MADLYADENFRYPVVAAMRRLGHNVQTCQEAGRAGLGIEDEVVLADAFMMRRVLLTENRRNSSAFTILAMIIGASWSARSTGTRRHWLGGSMRPCRRRSKVDVGLSG